MKIGLVLGGGGARGLTHIGVLQVLIAHGYEPVAIAGCSMGGIIGAMLSAGTSPESMQEIAENLSFVKLLDAGKMGGLVGGKGIRKFLEAHVPDTFEALAIPLTVTAVDVQEGKLVVLNEGPLVPALRATSAIPGMISPEVYHTRTLIDGGLLNNLPVDIIRTMTSRPVIAVDVAAPPNRKLDFDTPKDDTNLRERFRSVMKGTFFQDTFKDIFKRSLTIELFMKSFDVPQRVLTETRLAMNPPELLLRPKLANDFGIEDFHRLDEAIAIGREHTEQMLADSRLPDVLCLPNSPEMLEHLPSTSDELANNTLTSDNTTHGDTPNNETNNDETKPAPFVRRSLRGHG